MIATTDLVRELLYQVRLGEDSAYEFKSLTIKGNKVDQPGRDSVADELAAFANAGGGIIVFGVADKTRTVEGIAREDLARQAGVALEAVQRFESHADVEDETRLILAFRLEAEGLV